MKLFCWCVLFIWFVLFLVFVWVWLFWLLLLVELFCVIVLSVGCVKCFVINNSWCLWSMICLWLFGICLIGLNILLLSKSLLMFVVVFFLCVCDEFCWNVLCFVLDCCCFCWFGVYFVVCVVWVYCFLLVYVFVGIVGGFWFGLWMLVLFDLFLLCCWSGDYVWCDLWYVVGGCVVVEMYVIVFWWDWFGFGGFCVRCWIVLLVGMYLCCDLMFLVLYYLFFFCNG